MCTSSQCPLVPVISSMFTSSPWSGPLSPRPDCERILALEPGWGCFRLSGSLPGLVGLGASWDSGKIRHQGERIQSKPARGRHREQGAEETVLPRVRSRQSHGCPQFRRQSQDTKCGPPRKRKRACAQRFHQGPAPEVPLPNVPTSQLLRRKAGIQHKPH